MTSLFIDAALGGLVIGAFVTFLEIKARLSKFAATIFIVVLSIIYSAFLVSNRADAADPVDILTKTTLHLARGTGFILQADSGRNYLVTNWHVCNVDSWNGKIRGNHQNAELVQGTITKRDPLVDLCVARVEGEKAALKIAKTLKTKQEVYTRGYPYGVLNQTSGEYVGRQTWSYSFPIEEVGQCFPGSEPVRSGTGNIYACSVSYTDNLTSLYGRPGSSGSPVVDSSGALVGVVSSWMGETDLAGMVKLEDIKKFMEGL